MCQQCTDGEIRSKRQKAVREEGPQLLPVRTLWRFQDQNEESFPSNFEALPPEREGCPDYIHRYQSLFFLFQTPLRSGSIELGVGDAFEVRSFDSVVGLFELFWKSVDAHYKAEAQSLCFFFPAFLRLFGGSVGGLVVEFELIALALEDALGERGVHLGGE